jgi:hypothetical protein
MARRTVPERKTIKLPYEFTKETDGMRYFQPAPYAKLELPIQIATLFPQMLWFPVEQNPHDVLVVISYQVGP